MVQLIGHAFLNVVTEYMKACVLKYCLELRMSAHDTVVIPVYHECTTAVNVLFDKDETTFLTIRAFGQTFGFCFQKELG